MAKVLHIRGVPDEVHRALTEAAEAEGLSLTKYIQSQLRDIAGRAEAVRANAEVIRRTRARVQGRSDRETILEVLHEGRND